LNLYDAVFLSKEKEREKINKKVIRLPTMNSCTCDKIAKLDSYNKNIG
jgi:hypothetical protein